MKLIPTSSQTVGPFFSIGLEPLCQKQAEVSVNAIVLTGVVRDGDAQPIPDAVLEFWTAEKFTRVATSEDGSFSVVLPPIPTAANSIFFDVLIFMRGLLRPVRTRVYFGDVESIKNNPEFKSVPTDRMSTLVARKTAAPNRYGWDVFMQGDSETVFFHF